LEDELKKYQDGKGSDILARDRMEKSIEIKAPPEKVWEMLAWDRIQEWEKGWKDNLKSVEYTSEVSTLKDKYRVGASAHMTLKRGELDLEITESLENEKMTYQARGAWNGFLTYILEPVEEGTKFTYIVDIEIPLGILGRVLSRMVRGRGERDFATSLENLKSILEKTH
jgi:carbon monoxide dehydrogenase subunit G